MDEITKIRIAARLCPVHDDCIPCYQCEFRNDGNSKCYDRREFDAFLRDIDGLNGILQEFKNLGEKILRKEGY